ncbi:sensor domain-containing diguanylate cyclase [Pseudomonas sp. TMP25]|uniref:sensor domain-containing diguanylate cyclase n=1 Tax=Pseudomonas sp. TMP25 TaxID=3136561 RepID=UPI003101999D
MDEPLATSSLEAVSRPLLKLAKMLCGMQTSFITLIDWNNMRQSVLHCDSDPALPITEGTVVDWSESLCRRMFSNGDVQSCNIDSLFADTPGAGMGIKSFVVLPVVLADRTLGTFCVASLERVELDEQVLEQLQLISDALSYQFHLELEYQALHKRAEDRQQLIDDLHQQASTDPLTGLLNRRGFTLQWQRAMAHSAITGSSLAVMMIDIDHFKKLNDLHGHERGDAALIHVASALGRVTRKQDFVCRLGGDEFVVVAPGSDASGLEILGQRLQQQLQTVAHDLFMHVSIGIAAAPQHPVDDLLRLADQALYRSKQQGRNCINSA